MKSSNQFLLALATAFTLTACGGGGGGDSTTDGGSTSGGSTNISIPSDAITFDETNAKPVAELAISEISTTYALTGAFGADAQSAVSVNSAIKALTDKVFDRSRRTYNVVSGITGSDQCTGGGSFSYTYDETDNGESGSATFTNCIESSVTIDGTFRYTYTYNTDTGAYTDQGNGTVTIDFGSGAYTLALNYNETGNEINETYSMNISYSVSGFPGYGGWKVTTLQAIGGTWMETTTGQLLIEGANNTKVRLTVIAADTVRVELDTGSDYAEVPDSPFYL
ncbi:MAG TPA: hypothetical protein VIQ81_09590 [Gammaproteobacteria bacterium]